MKKFALACTTSALALVSVPAMAQEAPSSDATTAEPAGDVGITVTGSRLIKDGSNAPTPVTTITNDVLLQSSPSNIPDALNKLPQFTNSRSQYTGATFAADNQPMGNYLNLRGLEPFRALVLLDGYRVTPTSNFRGTDTNMLPQMLVSRVDVVTGGASATYGSDAVSGVINYVLDRKFTGLKLTAQSGVSTEGDAFSYRLGAAGGISIGDNAHIIASYEHYGSDGLPSLFNRDWAHGAPILTGAGTQASPYTQVANGTTTVLSNGGVINAGPLAGRQFLSNGTLVTFNPGTPTLSAGTSAGGDGAIYDTTLAARLKTDQAFARASFDLSPSIELFVQGSYGRSVSGFESAPSSHRTGGNRNTFVGIDNPYLRPEVVALMAANNITGVSIGRQFRDLPRMSQESTTNFYSGQIGLKGDIGSSWKWNVNYVYGKSTLDFKVNEIESRNYFAAIDVVAGPGGTPVCRVTLTNPTLLPGCVPMNVIGSGNVSPAALAFIRKDSKYRIVNRMDYVTANIQGDLFNLPAGPVSVALGAEYRHESLAQTSNADPAIWSGTGGAAARAAYFQGINNVPGSALVFLVTNVGLASGSQSVKEAYGEMQIPLLKDAPFAKNLELNLAARYTDYKTSGGVTTWKVGGSWTPVDGVRIRATRSRDIAAPSLFDLFAGANVRNIAVNDPVTNTNPVIQSTAAGNLALVPEKADTTVLGIVLQPRAIPGLTLSVDAYSIKINGAFATTSEQDIVNTCFATSTSPLCGLITRDGTPANLITKILVGTSNLAFLKTKGIDFEASYHFPLASGDLNLRAFAGYLDSYQTQTKAGQPILERAGAVIGGISTPGLAKWKGLLSQTYTQDRFSLSLSERFTGSYRRGIVGPTVATTTYFAAGEEYSPARTYVDLNVTFDVSENKRFQFFFNVQNLFNVDPPIIQGATATDNATPTDKTFYDIVGRYFTTGVRLKF